MRSAVSRIAPFLAATALLAWSGGALANDAPPGAAGIGPEADYPRILGDPFVIDGKTYTPVDTMNYDEVGYAAAQAEGPGISGSHRTLPLPSYVEVTSLDSGRTILVRLDSRGPMSGPALVTLSPAAWSQLGLPQGVAVGVRVRRVNPPEAERALLRSGQRTPERMETPKGLLAVLVRKLPPAPAGAIRPGIEPAPEATSPVLTGPVAAAVRGGTPAPQPAPAAKVPAPKEAPASVAPPNPAAVASSSRPGASAPSAAPAAVQAQRPATAPATSAPAGGLFVQAAAFSTRERADGAARKLGGSVTPAGRLFRVRVGPFASTAQADAALAKVRAAGYADARIVRAP